MAVDQTNLAWETLLALRSDARGDSPARDVPRAEAMHARLAESLRAGVREGRLPPGAALPPSRELALTLGVSRWVVTQAYGDLVAEGVLEARTGSATRIATTPTLPSPPTPTPSPSSSENGDFVGDLRRSGGSPTNSVGVGVGGAGRRGFDLAPGVPDLRCVPRAAWGRAVRAALSVAPDAAFAGADAAGLRELRLRLSAHLARARLTRADARDLVVTHGATDGLTRLARALRAAGHTTLAVEDPGWPRLGAAAARAGLTVVGVPVDDDGLVVDALARTGARAVLTTPAHQFPTGVALSPDRRERLVAWARAVDGLVIEDDYDAEFRYDRRAVAALQGLAPDRVALLGSTSKTLAPAFGIGWLVAPPSWRSVLDDAPGPSTIDQLAFAAFLASGDYDRHLRATRQRYRRRRAALLDALARHLPELRVTGLAAGMHVLLHLPGGVSPQAVADAAARREVTVAPLARYRSSDAPATAPAAASAGRDNALVVGYGNLADARVDDAVARLADAIRSGSHPTATSAAGFPL